MTWLEGSIYLEFLDVLKLWIKINLIFKTLNPVDQKLNIQWKFYFCAIHPFSLQTPFLNENKNAKMFVSFQFDFVQDASKYFFIFFFERENNHHWVNWLTNFLYNFILTNATRVVTRRQRKKSLLAATEIIRQSLN